MCSSDSEVDPSPDTDPQNLLNARFGSSVACLGAPDANSESVFVVVGAPYFKSVCSGMFLR